MTLMTPMTLMTRMKCGRAFSILLFGFLIAVARPTAASPSMSLEKNIATQTRQVGSFAKSPGEVGSGGRGQMNFVLERKTRIQAMLVTLDRLASLTQTMKPENAGRIEPVIVDLAEQAIDLANERALQTDTTERTLTQLETTVGELAKTMSRYVEPEATL